MEIVVGSVVTRVGSSTKMTVESIATATATCRWFDETTLHTGTFPVHELRLA